MMETEPPQTDDKTKNGFYSVSEEQAAKDLKIGTFELWSLGICIVIGGQYFAWNFALAAGFGSCAISVVIIGFSYICLCLCNSEVSSAHPFAGGAYGLARMTLGFYPGFLIGCCEAVEYIIYVASVH